MWLLNQIINPPTKLYVTGQYWIKSREKLGVFHKKQHTIQQSLSADHHGNMVLSLTLTAADVLWLFADGISFSPSSLCLHNHSSPDDNQLFTPEKL